MPAKLSVNLNAIAMLRNRRDVPWPSVTEMGAIAMAAGAHGLTVHPRPDERHIRKSDLAPLRALLDDLYPLGEFNMEGYPNPEFLSLVETVVPEQVTLVPDDPSQATSDHGWDFRASRSLLDKAVSRLKKNGFRVSLFADADADLDALKIARDIGADRIELYTGPYGGCHSQPEKAKRLLADLGSTADMALSLGLKVNAGHDLVVDNLPALAARIPDLAEVSIGHGLTADALIYGMFETVRRFRRACGEVIAN
ncbi:MAG: Pyridoxine 5-phosphate synthase synthase [Pseudomonadota bacterium]